jgi:peroxiredoxin (alkyl hydroperoxide reductase subunit C)
MKNFFLIGVLAFSVTGLWSQDKVEKPIEERVTRIPLIGEVAPSFTAETTDGVINFPGDFARKWKILFSHPQDFTPVCTTEIIELANLQSEFDKLGVSLVVMSADPLSTHLQWKRAMEGLSLNDKKPVKIRFPLVDDEKLVVSREYGMLHSATNSTKDVRGVFIIDPDDIIAAIYFYPMNVGRSTDELLRMVTALKATASSNYATPVNWKTGEDLLVPYNPNKNLSNVDAIPEGYYSPAWFMWYKKAN